MSRHVWTLHSAVFDLALAHPIGPFQLDFNVHANGDTVIALVLNPGAHAGGRADVKPNFAKPRESVSPLV